MERYLLHEIIDEAVKKPLVSIEAPSGSGKTTAIEQYMESENKFYIMLRASEMDNLPEHFWGSYLRTLAKQGTEIVSGIEPLGFPTTIPDFQEYLYRLSKYTNGCEDVYFIVDDFHLIHEESVIRFIENLVCADLEGHHTILISSRKPEISSDMLMKKDVLVTLKDDVFLLNESEIGELTLSYGLPYRSERIHHIFSITNGVIYAADLALLSIRKGKNIIANVKEIQSVINPLIRAVVFSEYSVRIQKALVKLAFAHTHPIELIEKLTGIDVDDIQVITATNPLIRYDAADHCLEIHSIMIEFLSTLKTELSKAEIDQVHYTIAKWFEDNNEIYDAIEYYRRCERYDCIWTILKGFTCKRLTREMCQYIEDNFYDIVIYFDQLDAEMSERTNSEFELFAAWLLINNNYLLSAQFKLLDIRDNLLGNEQDNHDLLGETYLFLGLTMFLLKDEKFEEYFIKAKEYLPNGSTRLSTDYLLIDINNGFCCKSFEPNEVERMFRAYERGMPHFIELTHGCGAGIIELAKGEMALHKGDLDVVEDYLDAAYKKAEPYNQYDIVLNVYFLMTRLKILQGKPKEALKYLRKLEKFKKSNRIHNRYAFLDVALSMLYINLGEYERMAAWIIDEKDYDDVLPPISAGRNLTLRGQWLCYKGLFEEAAEFVEEIENYFTKNHLSFSKVYAHLMKSTIYLRTKESPSDAIDNLVKVYELTKNSNMIMFMVERGSRTCDKLDFLKESGDTRIPKEWIEDIYQQSKDYQEKYNAFRELYFQKRESLSSMEVTAYEEELLKSLSLQKSREEIAKAFGISEELLKLRLKFLYQKLDVATPVEAIQAYQSLSQSR